MFDLSSLAERRIAEAMQRGDFDDLPGAGRPLDLEHEPLIPPELRLACRILRYAGLAPVEVLVRREIAELQDALAGLDGDAERAKTVQKLCLLRTSLGAGRSRGILRQRACAEQMLERLTAGGR